MNINIIRDVIKFSKFWWPIRVSDRQPQVVHIKFTWARYRKDCNTSAFNQMGLGILVATLGQSNAKPGGPQVKSGVYEPTV